MSLVPEMLIFNEPADDNDVSKDIKQVIVFQITNSVGKSYLHM